MLRTQIQLNPEQASKLKQIAGQSNESIAQVIRTSVDEFLSRYPGSADNSRYERALSVVGKFESSPGNVSEQHDVHLGEAFGS